MIRNGGASRWELRSSLPTAWQRAHFLVTIARPRSPTAAAVSFPAPAGEHTASASAAMSTGIKTNALNVFRRDIPTCSS
jgi:hypothetical protein